MDRGTGGANESADGRFLPRALAARLFKRRYSVYVPADFDASRVRPVVLFLHGSGERGRDGLRPTAVGLGEAIRRSPERFPAVVVFPQARPREYWSGAAAGYALAALERTIQEFRGDPERIYGVGLSMGGYGILRMAGESPDRFAAVVAVCGGILPPPSVRVRRGQAPAEADPYAAAADRIRGVPVRLYHGADDPMVPCEESRRLARALKERGGNVLYTEYPKTGHDSWTPAFEDPELWRWLFAQRRHRRAAGRAPSDLQI